MSKFKRWWNRDIAVAPLSHSMLELGKWEREAITINKSINWQSLHGKSLKIVVAEPNGTVIGIDEETGKAYTLHDQTPFMIKVDANKGIDPNDITMERMR